MCKQMLPADDLQDVRKQRHSERHTRTEYNNITTGTLTWYLVDA